jgi:putative DNA methylase
MSEYDELCSRVGRRSADRLVGLGLLARPVICGSRTALHHPLSTEQQRPSEISDQPAKNMRTAARKNIDFRGEQPGLPFATRLPESLVPSKSAEPCALEDDNFPFELLSEIAERESWRKEVNRPLSHIHKWWAQRLGSVFRAIVIGALAPKGSRLLDLFYSPTRFSGSVVYDPFMGSGTTLVEVLKLGARAIGRDINPVSHFLVRNALTAHDRASVINAFRAIERDVAGELKSFYRAKLPNGIEVPVLYYFWVKTLPCPACQAAVDLFSSFIFAQHAYPKKYPHASALCPHCGDVNSVRFDAETAKCSSCDKSFDPLRGPAHGKNAQCPCCNHRFAIAKAVRQLGTAPKHRMYAKLVLMPDGKKVYLRADTYDEDLYAHAERKLKERKNYPEVAIKPGHNTSQALGYNYKYWHEFFNARQLLCLSILAERIRLIDDVGLRELFTCLFSGTLEFNNMFASYKGEGTGAVRHIFYHHILKPERTPLEANLWGTPKSSGSFSTMFETRIQRALDYAEHPFELRLTNGKGSRISEKVYSLSESIGFVGANNFAQFEAERKVYISCGDSSRTDLATGVVDVIVTDPPFFDNVHYSELADFFHVWQRHILGLEDSRAENSTRSNGEVQSCDEDEFTSRLTAVWSECLRVLRDDGLLVFTYHHSRPTGWRSILRALLDAGFATVSAHPIKAEMSVATPKHQAREPIDIDIIVVCRKKIRLLDRTSDSNIWPGVGTRSSEQVRRLRATGRMLSRNDIRVIVMGQFLCALSAHQTTTAAIAALDANSSAVDDFVESLFSCPQVS